MVVVVVVVVVVMVVVMVVVVVMFCCLKPLFSLQLGWSLCIVGRQRCFKLQMTEESSELSLTMQTGCEVLWMMGVAPAPALPLLPLHRHM